MKAPVLIVVTTHDPFGTFDQAVAMSDAWPHSSISVISRCGHSPMWEKPGGFVHVVEAFLKWSNLPSSPANLQATDICRT